MKSFFKKVKSSKIFFMVAGGVSFAAVSIGIAQALGAFQSSSLAEPAPSQRSPAVAEVVQQEKESLQDIVMWMMDQPKCQGSKATLPSQAQRVIRARQVDRILSQIGGDRHVQCHRRIDARERERHVERGDDDDAAADAEEAGNEAGRDAGDGHGEDPWTILSNEIHDASQ